MKLLRLRGRVICEAELRTREQGAPRLYIDGREPDLGVDAYAIVEATDFERERLRSAGYHLAVVSPRRALVVEASGNDAGGEA